MFWLIAVPNNPNEDECGRLRGALKEKSLGTVHKFAVPALRVGTLDALMSLSDDLYKIDNHVESIGMILCPPCVQCIVGREMPHTRALRCGVRRCRRRTRSRRRHAAALAASSLPTSAVGRDAWFSDRCESRGLTVVV